MLLDPVNAVTSVNFYRKIASQSPKRTAGYLLYVALIFSFAATAALKVKVGPQIEETFVWLSQSMPPLTFQNGRVTSAAPGPVTLRHPKIEEISVVVDTTRAEPVTPETLASAKVLGYLTGTALYLRTPQGNLETYDFSKSPSANPAVIDASFYRNAGATLQRVLYPLAFLIGLAGTAVWKSLAALFYTLVALMINAITESRRTFPELFNISAYAQTLVIVVECIFLFMPVGIPAFPAISLIATGAYIWLALKKLNEPAPAA